MSDRRRIAVAMSGGVDSSVVAGLLHEAGEDVFGLMLRLQDETEAQSNRCCAPSDIAAARAVAATLGMPFYVVDARQTFEEEVVRGFIRGYAQGLTPNPCIECNRSVRFGFLLEHALALGATHLATGHYARTRATGDRLAMLVAQDTAKDQSYVLYTLTQAQLARTIFPLGEMRKSEVRDLARRMQLAVAERPESQDLCFVHDDYRAFLAARGVPGTPGPIADLAGTVLGTHAGLQAYTFGQRKGLGLASRQALYVVDKDTERNILVVGGREQIGRQQFSVTCLHWIADAPPDVAFDASVQVRYHAPRTQGHIRCSSPTDAVVELGARNPDVAAGQSAVFYLDEVCLGGGIIKL